MRYFRLPDLGEGLADADIVESAFGNVPLDKVMGTGRFDFEKAHDHPLWAKELYGFEGHVPETEEYGIESFVYRGRQPFDPAKLFEFFNEPWPNVVRAKGFFWLATRPEWLGEVSQAGALVRHSGGGTWWSAVPQEQWPDRSGLEDYLSSVWGPVYGDRRQEIVFIGIDMDPVSITARLDACLTDAHLDRSGTITAREDLSDPFPKWRRQ